ncbi:MAG TPA: hypothetical protein DHW85_04320, partial [Lachnospiraceae bacterium]|nr:hypothetical protein [Lachnospiraceae bacterium]
ARKSAKKISQRKYQRIQILPIPGLRFGSGLQNMYDFLTVFWRVGDFLAIFRTNLSESKLTHSIFMV